MDIEIKIEKENIFQIEFEDINRNIKKQRKTIDKLSKNLRKIALAKINGFSGEC